MQERRKAKRKSLAASLEIYSHNMEKSFGKGFITNLGEGGMALETHKNLHLGERLLLRFTLPNAKVYNVQGEIVYAQDGVLTKAYGAKFCEISSQEFRELQEYIARNNHKSVAPS